MGGKCDVRGGKGMIALGSDHAGLELKREISRLLDELGLAWLDVGTDSTASCDYPVYGRLAAEAVADGRCDRGIIFCGTGIGISLAANKVPGIRCAVCSEGFSAVLSRRHNNCNMLALGGRVVGFGLARMIVRQWLEAEFEGGRHERRVTLIEPSGDPGAE
jgi:ribose 5-phosphate isomerase B